MSGLLSDGHDVRQCKRHLRDGLVLSVQLISDPHFQCDSLRGDALRSGALLLQRDLLQPEAAQVPRGEGHRRDGVEHEPRRRGLRALSQAVQESEREEGETL